jgi:putative endonuclease
MRDSYKFGKDSEAVAAKYLKNKGYKIIEQNYRNRIGEIDIIAKDKNALVFVEVKARKSNYFGSAKWGVTPTKQRKMSMVALQYLKETNQVNTKARFDVVAINSRKDFTDIELIKNAFNLVF